MASFSKKNTLTVGELRGLILGVADRTIVIIEIEGDPASYTVNRTNREGSFFILRSEEEEPDDRTELSTR